MGEKEFTAVIDSGIGGLSVLALARQSMPEENFCFFADAANAPYGDKDPGTIRNIIRHLVNNITSRPVKAILLACNTATSAAANMLRAELSIPVIGVEPALKPAVEQTTGQILVMATQLTIRETKFQNLLQTYGKGRNVIPLPCPGLMELIEKDPLGEDTAGYLQQLLVPYSHTAEAVVLGCTHYVFLRPLFQKHYPRLKLFDGNAGVVRHLKNTLSAVDSMSCPGSIAIECSLPQSDTRTQYLDKCQKMLKYCESLYAEKDCSLTK